MIISKSISIHLTQAKYQELFIPARKMTGCVTLRCKKSRMGISLVGRRVRVALLQRKGYIAKSTKTNYLLGSLVIIKPTSNIAKFVYIGDMVMYFN